MNEDKTVEINDKKNEEIFDKKNKKEENLTDEVKNRINLTLAIDHPFAKLQNNLKKRGVKNIDFNKLLLDVFDQIPEKWWEEKTEMLTPLEYKINAALLDPTMRQKISALLENEDLAK